jgi:Leucine-rich repeat (LRR) protein
MPSDSSPDYSLKRLRDLCLHVHEENMAFLLRSTLAEFPIPVIDEFFTGPKLNKPGGPDDREWTDLVRLIFIAFAPAGSEPGKLKGKPIERYKREYPFNPKRPDADEVGKLTLYPTEHTTPLLKDIAIALGIRKLQVYSGPWFSRYFQNSFPLTSLSVYTTKGADGLESDLSQAFDSLPLELEDLSIDTTLPFSADGMARLVSLKSLYLSVESLPKGLDFSQNKALESLHLNVRSQANSAIKGLGALQSLKSVSISCSVPSHYDPDGTITDGSVDSVTVLESLGDLLKRGIKNLNLEGVRCAETTLEGKIEGSLGLKCVAGLSRVAVTGRMDSPTDIRISESNLEALEIAGGGDLMVDRCVALKSVKASLKPSRLHVKDCPMLSDVSLSLEPCSPYEIEFCNLRSLSSLKMDAAEVKMDADSNAQPRFRIINCGMARLPRFTGGWRGLAALDLVGNRFLECLDGIDALPDLQILRVRSVMVKGWSDRTEHPSVSHNNLKALFSSGSPVTELPLVSSLVISGAPLESLAGIGMFPNVESVTFHLPCLKSLDGMEALSLLKRADLSGCSMRNLAPLAALSNLVWLKSSGCSRIKPKLPHTVMEGPELIAELARHVGADHPIAKIVPSEELTKIVQLIGEGERSDVTQALSLLPVLSPEERDKLLAGAAIDPKTGWVRLPYLSKIKEEEAMGIPQLRILTAIGGAKADALLASVTEIVVNYDGDPNQQILRFGKKPEYGNYDDILEEFDSIGSLPVLPNVRKISINRVSRFSLRGVGNFPGLQDLTLNRVDHLEGVSELAGLASLKKLKLEGVKLTDLTCLGSHPLLETLWLSDEVTTLEGLENFPKLGQLIISRVGDLAVLNRLSAEHGWKVSCRSSGFVDEGMPVFFTIERRGS